MLCARRAAIITYGDRRFTTANYFYHNGSSSFPVTAATVQSSKKASFRWAVTDATRFEEQIELFVRSLRPSEKVLRLRADIMKRIGSAVVARHGQQYSVEQFGSSVYGVDLHTSDLDLVLLDHSNPNGFHPDVSLTTLPDVYDLNTIVITVRKAKFAKVYGVPASIPIVKGVDKLSGLSIDLNTNDRLGLINTRMIRHYCDISPLLVPMLYFIKMWAKSHDLNSPSLGGSDRSLSSYCYALMTIGYLQRISVLPNLQEGLSKIPVSGNLGYWVKNKTGTERTFCDTRYNQLRQPPLQASRVSLAEATHGWFRYWGFEHQYERDKLAVRLGGVAPRQRSFPGPRCDPQGRTVVHRRSPSPESCPYSPDRALIHTALDAPNPEHWRHNLLVVEDPFIRARNVAGNIQNHVVELLKRRCRATVSVINTTRSPALALAPGPYRKQFVMANTAAQGSQ